MPSSETGSGSGPPGGRGPRARRPADASEARSTAQRDLQVRRVLLIEGGANAAILVLKASVGWATGSLAILGDAVHSLTDLSNNLVAWVVVRLSARPADQTHPYGHRKFETLAVFGLAMLLTLLAVELALGALRRGEREVVQTGGALGLMLGVLGVNVALAAWQGRWARRLDSDILRADARHTLADVLTTIVVICGWQAGALGYPWLDTAAAIGVAGLILFLAFGLFRNSIPVLVDRVSLDPEQIVDAALGIPGVVGIRAVRSRRYGAQAAVDIVVVVASELSTVESHEIANQVERAIRRQLPAETVTVHIEPAQAPS